MKSFITSNDIPIGYVTPSFPSLYWPISNDKYNYAYLYDQTTIWKFTIYWSVILNAGFYAFAGTLATLSYRKRPGALLIVVVYLFTGSVQGIVCGTITAYLIGSIYLSGLFPMSTWIPLCCAVVQVLFDVCTSFSMAGMIM